MQKLDEKDLLSIQNRTCNRWRGMVVTWMVGFDSWETGQVFINEGRWWLKIIYLSNLLILELTLCNNLKYGELKFQRNANIKATPWLFINKRVQMFPTHIFLVFLWNSKEVPFSHGTENSYAIHVYRYRYNTLHSNFMKKFLWHKNLFV